jgi:tetratricopeptide (TPR) repeat protein
MVCVNRAVALSPDNRLAHILLAKCLFIAGEPAAALAAAEAASSKVGFSPEALDALGAMFGLLGQHERALNLFHRAVAARPTVPQYLFNLAATERMLGMLEAAESHCDAVTALNRRYCLVHYLRSDLRIQSRERNHIDEMETLLREGELGSESEVMLRFALAKEYEDLGEHARRSLRLLRAANCSGSRFVTTAKPRSIVSTVSFARRPEAGSALVRQALTMPTRYLSSACRAPERPSLNGSLPATAA